MFHIGDGLGKFQFFVGGSSIVLFLLLFWAEYVYARREGGRYSKVDAATNLTLYFGALLVDFIWAPVVYLIYSLVYVHSFHLVDRMGGAAYWASLFLVVDFCYYWFHRTSHTRWLLWAAHEIHHSSAYFNLSVAGRKTWTPFLAFIYWAPLPLLGFKPWAILTLQMVSLSYQSLLHTEVVRSFGPLDWIFNSPSHHRVHHGKNHQYLNKNFGGIFIIWDRLFGTFEPECERAVYGLSGQNIEFQPVRASLVEYLKLMKTVSEAKGFKRIQVLIESPLAVGQNGLQNVGEKL